MSPRIRGRRTGSIDDDDAELFDRPRRRTRPRTKDHPDYSEAALGRVLGVDRGRFEVALNGPKPASIRAMKARALGRKGVIVGDEVRLVGDLSGTPGTLARIVAVAPRQTVLRRTADDTDPSERPIVANADQLMIVVALADPPPRIGMIDRILVAAYDAHITPLLCLTKRDLASATEILAHYQGLQLVTVQTQPGSDLSELRDLLSGHVTVLVGHSGVGKSTLINELVPGANRSTGAVNEVTGRGRHTSTSAVALPLPTAGEVDGWVIDTPGVRSFGLSHVRVSSIVGAFSDIEVLVQDCPRGCLHTTGAPDCALDSAVVRGDLDPGRLASFRRIIEAVGANRPN